MPLTPADVRHVMFSKPPPGRPGYHEDEVDDFLDLVEAELARMMQDTTALRAQVTRLNQRLGARSRGAAADWESPQAAGPVITPLQPSVTPQTPPRAEHDSRAAHVLAFARERADQLTEQAHATADEVRGQARADCERLLFTARGQADDVITQARTRAETILRDAHTTAQTLQRQARDNAASLEHQATRRRAEVLNALNHDKSRLETTIDELRAFELEYRTRLATYLHSLIHQLDGPASAAPVHPIQTQHDLVGSRLDIRHTGP
jgi:DivIVA domain-containing protein